MINAYFNWIKATLVLGIRYPVAAVLVATVKFTKISDLSKIAFLDSDNFGWFNFLDLAKI